MVEEYYKSKASVAEYISMAEGINGANLIEKLQLFLPQSSNVLEIGSGPGSDWEILNKLYKVVGSDNSPEFLNHLKKKYPEGKFLELDARILKTEFSFDGIYSNKVLHHLKDDELNDSIQNQLALLKTGGVVCHSFWFGESFEVFKGMYVNYHNEDSLTQYFGNEFEVLLLEVYKEFDEGDSILLIAKKK